MKNLIVYFVSRKPYFDIYGDACLEAIGKFFEEL